MDVKRIDRGELIAIVGGIVLGVSLFLSWYSLGNKYALLEECRGPNTTCTGWHSLALIRYLLLIAAAAPLILTYVIVRGHGLSWPRGELTAVTAMAALTMIFFRGIIDKPGTPHGEISIDWGWGVAFLGGLLILVGAIVRSQESQGRRKPPGVL